MNWKIRHQGSPKSIEGLSVAQVIEGLRDGQWEPTDEVMGPDDADWGAIEDHAQFAETVADYEPPPPPQHDDETRLDMNPLIDVALVLLIFFILTTTYESVRKVLDAPTVRPDSPTAKRRAVSDDEIKKLMIRVEARQVDGKPVIKVENEVVEEQDLEKALRKFVSESKKTEILIDALGVEWGTLVTIQDAAQGAGIHQGHYLRGKTPPPPK